MLRYKYAGIREMKVQMEKESRHMSRIMRTSTGTVTKVVSIRFVKQEKRKQKGGCEYRTEHKTKTGKFFLRGKFFLFALYC